MKKRFVTILAILTSASVLWADPIDLARAKRIATAYMSEGVMPETVKSIVQTRNTTTGTSPLYIFNRGNDQGFVIISGDDCMPEVLGYTEKGDFNPNELPPALLDWIEGYSTMISKAQETNASPLAAVPLAATAKQDIAPLVTAHWSQGAPYNNLCPYRNDGGGRAVTGCVATAASQVIYYWRKELPRKTLYDTPTYGYGEAPVTESIPVGTPMKYELMQDYYSSSTPADMNEAVATLMSVVGTSTWLTYGSSTSGQISNLVNTFWGQFHLNSTCTYKSGYTQSAWEAMIYEDLEKGWPIVYSGVSPTQGGHAVIIDGYRAADNLFHFNFGWGGSGDGYFTVNDTNGMNGFNEQQGMTHRIHPSATLLTGQIKTTELCIRQTNTVEVEVTNNGTAGCSGVYVYSSRTEGAPSDISSANMKDLTTVIAQGETKTLTFNNYRPTSAGTYYVYLMDEYARVLDQTTINAVEQTPMLALEDLIVRSGIPAQTEIMADGAPQTITYHTVYGDQAEVTAQISNAEEATLTTPYITAALYAYNEEQGTWVSQKNLSTMTQQFPKGETTDLTFTLAGLDGDQLYAVSVSKTYKANSTNYTMDVNANDTIVYFTISESDLSITGTEEGGVTLAGHWNANKFKELVDGENYAYYDLSAVEGVDACPETSNPNTLFYVNENSSAGGRNIIKNGVCEQLHLVYGNDFKAKGNFKAQQATFEIDNTPLQWSYIALPFECKVPEGSMARRITKLTSSLISGADAVNETMEGGIPYLYKSTRDGINLLTAENVEVCAAPKELSDTLKATFTSFYGTEGMRKLNTNEIQKFTTARNVAIPAFSGYLNYNAADVEADAFIYSTQDAASKELATALNEAFATEEKYEGKVSEEIWDTFINTLDNAAACYTQQSSVEEMEDMATALTEIVNEVVINEIFLGIPIDLTNSYIENPSFEKGRITGWTIVRETGQLNKIQNITTLAEYTVNADGNYVFYSYSTTGKGSMTLKQTLTGLQKGYYRVAAKIATEEGASVTMFANDKTATMTDDGFGIRYLTETVIDDIEVADGTLEIGINGTENAYKADDFRLYYLGELENSVTNIRPDEHDLKAWGGEGIINLLAGEDNPVDVSIYTTDGRLCRRLRAEGFHQVTNLPKGIYIVNRQKVVVR